MKAAGVGCWEIDLATLEIRADEATLSLFSLPSSDQPASAADWLAAIEPADRERLLTEGREILQSGATHQLEVRLAKRPERAVTLRGSVGFSSSGDSASGDAASGEPRRVSGIAMAAAHLPGQLLLQLGRERELLDRIVETIPVMLTIYDPAVTHLKVNREFTRVLGWTPQDSLEIDLFSACYPDPAERERAFQFMNSLAPGWQDFRVSAKNGEVVESSWANIRLSDQRMVGIGIDIRERLAAERDLKESEDRLKLALDSMELGTFDYDLRSRRVEWSERTRKIFGIAPQDPIHFDDIWQFIPEEDAARIADAVRSATKNGTGRYALEHRVVRRNGSQANAHHTNDAPEPWVSVYGRVQFDRQGTPVRYTGVTLDITERKRAEAALAEARARQEIVTHVASGLLKTQNPQEIIDDLASLVMRKTGADVYVSYLVPKNLDRTHPRLQLNSYASVGAAISPLAEWLDFGDSVCGSVALEGVRRICYGIQQSDEPTTSLLRAEGVHTFCCHPLVGSNGVLGTLGFGSRTRDHFRTEDVALMKTVADHIAIAIERMRDRQAIQESEARYKAIARHIPDGAVLVVDRELRFIAVEGSLVERLRSSAAEGASVETQPVMGTLVAHFRGALEGIAATQETRDHGLDLRIHYVPLRNEEGNVFAAMALAFDITERKQAEDALRESERRERAKANELEAVMDAVPAATWVARDTEGNLAYANRLAHEILRLPPGTDPSLVSNFMAEYRFLRQGKDVPSEDLPLRFAARTGKAVRDCELEIVYPDGVSRYLFGSVVPLLGGEGKSNGAVAAFIDLTERKKVEEQLRQAQKLESIGVLAGGVAHDFNNLLTGVLGNASLAQMDAPPRIMEKLERITDAAEKAAGLTRQLLAYAGKGQFMVTNVDLASVIRSSSELIGLSVTKNIEVVMSGVPGTLPLVRADSAQLQQVVMNLVLNAAEAIGATQPGIITLTAGSLAIRNGGEPGRNLPQTLAPGNYVFFRVADTGCGMDAETRAKIFDPFFTTKFTGRGLGLAAVHGAVRALNGAIDVESQLNAGSAFTVYLPSLDQTRPVSSSAVPQQAPGVRPATILIVDDEGFIRDLGKMGMERFGHKVLLAANGKQAMEIMEREPGIQLIVLDVVMPVMGGVETLREIRARWPKIPVLLTSGFNREEARRLGSLSPDVAFIQKPYTVQQLAAAVHSALAM